MLFVQTILLFLAQNQLFSGCYILVKKQLGKAFMRQNKHRKTYLVIKLQPPRSGQISTFKSGLLLAGFIVLIANCEAHTDWFMYWAPTLTHCASPLTTCAWFITWISNSISILVLFSNEARVTFPSSNNAMSFNPSFAEDVSVVVLSLGLRCSLI